MQPTAQKTRGIRYNPVLKNGYFEVFGVKITACDAAEARYHAAKKTGVKYGTRAYFDAPLKTLVPTIRKYND